MLREYYLNCNWAYNWKFWFGQSKINIIRGLIVVNVVKDRNLASKDILCTEGRLAESVGEARVSHICQSMTSSVTSSRYHELIHLHNIK